MNALAKQRQHTLVALSIHPPNRPLPTNLTLVRYGLNRGNSQDIHSLAQETESKVIRGEACARAAYKLKQEGFIPDLICAHPGWGESLFMQDIWPNAAILSYQEFYYSSENSDSDFDAEFQKQSTWEDKAKVRMKNAYLQLTLESSSWNVTPTAFQRNSFPNHWKNRISTIHDGVNTYLACPNPNPEAINIPKYGIIKQGDPLITFVNRTLEPYRGCHTFIRAIPKIQLMCPEAIILIVGKTKGVSYGRNCPKGEWKDYFLTEIEGKYNPKQVVFCGDLSYDLFLKVLQLSQAHVYLTYPFVLSWSLLEAMSTGCSVIASNTAPLQDVIRHEYNGLLVDFFSPEDLAENIALILKNPSLATQLGREARKTILESYSLDSCLPRHLSLIDLVASGSMPG